MRTIQDDEQLLAILQETQDGLYKSLLEAHRSLAEMEARLAWSNSRRRELQPASSKRFKTDENG
jgi:hypothetical protein